VIRPTIPEVAAAEARNWRYPERPEPLRHGPQATGHQVPSV